MAAPGFWPPVAARLARLGRLLRLRTRSGRLAFSLIAIIVGLAGGGLAILFQQLVAGFQKLFFGHAGASLAEYAAGLPWWAVLLPPVLGGCAVAVILRWLVPDGRPHGPLDLIDGQAIRPARDGACYGLGAGLASAVTLGSGGSAGQEGPIVHLAGSLAGVVASHMRLRPASGRLLLGCGAAAAIAAAFNAPFAGVFFALEVITLNYALAGIAPVVISSVTGAVLSRVWHGDTPAFDVPVREIASMWEFPAFVLLGVLAGLAAAALIRAVDLTQLGMTRCRLPRGLRPPLAGLLVGMIALVYPQVLGVGYGVTGSVLLGGLPLSLCLMLLAAKFTATAITLGGGFGGGIFSPSLLIGALLGAAFGAVAPLLLPVPVFSGQGAYAVIGMGALTGAVLGAPVSTVLMVFELTADSRLMVAVLVATMVAVQVCDRVAGHSFFGWQRAQRAAMSPPGPSG